MFSGEVIMMKFDNFLLQVVIFWDVDMSTMEDNAIFKVPVFESFGKSAWAIVRKCSVVQRYTLLHYCSATSQLR